MAVENLRPRLRPKYPVESTNVFLNCSDRNPGPMGHLRSRNRNEEAIFNGPQSRTTLRQRRDSHLKGPHGFRFKPRTIRNSEEQTYPSRRGEYVIPHSTVHSSNEDPPMLQLSTVQRPRRSQLPTKRHTGVLPMWSKPPIQSQLPEQSLLRSL